MEDDYYELIVLLREEDRPCDEFFVDDVNWLIGLDIDLRKRRREAMHRWSIDLASALAVGAVGYVITDNAPRMAPDIPAVLSIPLLIAAFIPALWLFTRSQSFTT